MAASAGGHSCRRLEGKVAVVTASTTGFVFYVLFACHPNPLSSHLKLQHIQIDALPVSVKLQVKIMNSNQVVTFDHFIRACS